MNTRLTLHNFYWIVTILNLIVFPLLYFLIPNSRDYFTREDNFMENLTVIIFLESFIFGCFFLLKSKNKFNRKIYAILPLFGLIGVLDELSFGERIFNFSFPIIGGKKIDGIHDFIDLFYYQIFKINKTQFIIASLLILFALIYFVSKYVACFKISLLENILKTDTPLKFVMFLIGFAIMSIFCDLDIIRFRGRVFLEELFEMNVALSLLFACFSIPNKTSDSLSNNNIID